MYLNEKKKMQITKNKDIHILVVEDTSLGRDAKILRGQRLFSMLSKNTPAP